MSPHSGTSIPIPSYCYVLVSGSESVPSPCQEEEGCALFPGLVRTAPSSDGSRGCETDDCEVTTRDTLYSRVVYFQPEVGSCGCLYTAVPKSHTRSLSRFGCKSRM